MVCKRVSVFCSSFASTSISPLYDLWTKGLLSNSYVSGLFFGSSFNIELIIVWRSFEYWYGILSKIPAHTFLYNADKSWAVNGGLRAAISYKTHPNDQISLLTPYGWSFQT